MTRLFEDHQLSPVIPRLISSMYLESRGRIVPTESCRSLCLASGESGDHGLREISVKSECC